MWAMIIFSILSFGLAGLFNGVMDTLQFHYGSSPFPKDSLFWNPSLSWRNKYKNGDPGQGPRFPGSTTIFVLVTDGWHLMKALNLAFYRLAIVLAGAAFWQFSETPWQNTARWAVVWIGLIFVHSAGFHLTYSVILKQRQNEGK